MDDDTKAFVRADRYWRYRMRFANERVMELDYLFRHLVDHTDALDFDCYGLADTDPSIYLR